MEGFRLVIISGVSGSGKSTALKAFDDIGYFCVDNLPAPLISHFVDYLESLPQVGGGAEAAVPHNFALLLHTPRDRNFFPLIQTAVQRLRQAGTEVILLFFDCQEDVVVRRFQETRRPHPLTPMAGAGLGLREALALEKELLVDFREAADRIIDTSAYTPHDLRRAVETFFSAEGAEKSRLELTLMSFGFKYGIPVHSDIVLDVRFLPNPHFVPHLKPLTGHDAGVSEYVFKSDDAHQFLARISAMLQFLIPRYIQEGKRYLTVSLGCTGGRHRSVAIAQRLAESLGDLDVSLVVRHRDLERNPL